MNQHNFLVRAAMGVGLVKRTVPAARMQTVNEAATAPASVPATQVRRTVGFQGMQQPQMATQQRSAQSGTARHTPVQQIALPKPAMPDGSPTRGSDLDIHTVIPAAAQLNGDLHIEESIVLQCVVRGNVTQEGDHQVVLSETGGIHGTLRAHTAVIGGTIEGDVFADRIVVLETGVIHGNVEYTTLAMKEGATINGALMRVVPNVLADSDGGSAAMLRAESPGLRAVSSTDEERAA
jgi:cytoskeletal protein CcmA (bactofilin family)